MFNIVLSFREPFQSGNCPLVLENFLKLILWFPSFIFSDLPFFRYWTFWTGSLSFLFTFRQIFCLVFREISSVFFSSSCISVCLICFFHVRSVTLTIWWFFATYSYFKRRYKKWFGSCEPDCGVCNNCGFNSPTHFLPGGAVTRPCSI